MAEEGHTVRTDHNATSDICDEGCVVKASTKEVPAFLLDPVSADRALSCQVVMLMSFQTSLYKNAYFINNLNLISTKSQSWQWEATMGKVQLVPLSLN